MLLQQKPIAGYWYTNIVGQLVQVRALLYTGRRLTCVALEYANGKREYVDTPAGASRTGARSLIPFFGDFILRVVRPR
jgi:hypothetical protein